MAQQGNNSKTATATERQSVVGMFDERRDALAARDALARRGYEDIDANLMPADELGPNGMSEEEYQRYQEAVGFLFEAGADDEAGIYLEALRRGATLLTVTTNPQHVSEVRKLMDDHGAADIAGRAEQWRSSGWKSFDRRAKPMTPAEVAVAKAK